MNLSMGHKISIQLSGNVVVCRTHAPVSHSTSKFSDNLFAVLLTMPRDEIEMALMENIH